MSVILWIFLIIGVAIAFIPQLIAFRYQEYTQAELAKKFPEYETINLSFIGYFTVFLVVMIPTALWVFNLERTYFEIIIPVWLAIIFSGLGMTYGLFAVRKGVYPVSKYFFGSTRYAYSEDNKVVRLGQSQIKASFIYFALAIFASLIRLLLYIF